MATDDVYNLAIEATLNGRPVVNTMSLRLKTNTEPTSSDWQGLATSIANWLNDAQVDDLVYSNWRATKVRGAGASYQTTAPFFTSTVSFSGGFGSTITGALTSPPLPNNCAILCSVQTDQSGRRRQGRFFLGGISELWVDDNSLINPTQLATLQTQLDLMEAALKVGGASGTHEMGVWSMRIATNAKYVWTVNGPVLTSQGPVSPATAYMGMTALVARGFVSSQRDRRPGL